jgi:hypothetical protein
MPLRVLAARWAMPLVLAIRGISTRHSGPSSSEATQSFESFRFQVVVQFGVGVDGGFRAQPSKVFKLG